MQLVISHGVTREEKYLWGTKESITVTQSDRLGRRGDSQVSNVHARLATTNNQDILANAKLSSLLEFRRVNNSWDILQSLNVRDVWSDVQARAYGNGIASIFKSLTALDVLDNVSTFDTRTNLSHRRGETDMWQQLEQRGISLQVGAVLGCKEEIRRLWVISVIGEGGELSRRDKLRNNTHQQVSFASSLK
jgi:hypothetical protein